tara:strand:+ start:611 stop:1198 length:588 start_codon:yes stop_codon:yes gene_type:complete
MPRNKTFDQLDVVKDAVTLFWEHGFHQTSIQDLVKKLGVNRASLYDTYGDKEGLFRRCLTNYRNEVLLIAQEIIKSDDSAKTGICNLFNWFTESLTNDSDKKGCFVCNTYAELLPSLTKYEISDLLNETKNLWINLLLDLLKKAKENKEIKSNINLENTAHGIYASMIGTSILSKTNTNKSTLKNTLNIHLKIFI